jgi:CBS domain-containing protein
MYVEGIGAAPVIDEEGKLVGIVTRREILDDLARTESVEPAEHTD